MSSCRAPQQSPDVSSDRISPTTQRIPLPDLPAQADDSSVPYFAPPSQSTSDYCEVNVYQEGYAGSFYHEVETSLHLDLAQLIRRQPAQIQQRTKWPADIDSVFKLDLHGEYPRNFQTEAVPPRPLFANNAVVNSRRWPDHCADLWSLFKSVHNGEQVTSFGLETFLILASYGMRDVVAVSPAALIINEHCAFRTNKQIEASDRTTDYLPDWMEVPVSAELSLGYTSKYQLKRATFNKRFFIGLVNYQGVHWASYIFDRQQGHVYYYDTLRIQLEERRKVFALSFRQFLAENGYPYNFTVFCPPVTIQPSTYEGGYLASFLVFTNLRSLVGASRKQLVERSYPSSIEIDGFIGLKADDFCLPQRDWVIARYPPKGLINAEVLETALSRVKQFICLTIMDELGIRRYTVSDRRVSRNLAALGDYTYRLMTNFRELDVSCAHTKRGGFQVIEWPSFPVATNWTQDRVVAIPEGCNVFFRIEPPDINPPKFYAFRPISQEVVDALRFRGVTSLKYNEMTSFNPVQIPNERTSPRALKALAAAPDSSDDSPKCPAGNGKLIVESTQACSWLPQKEESDPPKRKGHRARVPNQRPAIDGLPGEVPSEEEIAKWRQAFEQNNDDSLGMLMTSNAARCLQLNTVKDRPTYRIDRIGTYTTFVPDGLVSKGQWDNIFQTVKHHLYNPAPTFSHLSRQQRRDRRQQIRDKKESS